MLWRGWRWWHFFSYNMYGSAHKNQSTTSYHRLIRPDQNRSVGGAGDTWRLGLDTWNSNDRHVEAKIGSRHVEANTGLDYKPTRGSEVRLDSNESTRGGKDWTPDTRGAKQINSSEDYTILSNANIP